MSQDTRDDGRADAWRDTCRYRTLWRRFWAGLVDTIVLHPGYWIDKWLWASVTTPALRIAWFTIWSLAYLAYSIVLHGLFGQTLGKRLLGVKVYDKSGSKLSMHQALLRDAVPLCIELYWLVAALPAIAAGENPHTLMARHANRLPLLVPAVWGLLEIVTMALNARRRAVHDWIAGSVVMRVER